MEEEEDDDDAAERKNGGRRSKGRGGERVRLAVQIPEAGRVALLLLLQLEGGEEEVKKVAVWSADQDEDGRRLDECVRGLDFSAARPRNLSSPDDARGDGDGNGASMAMEVDKH